MFITYISLICYYRIYRLLAEKNLLSKYSPLDILKYMSEIKSEDKRCMVYVRNNNQDSEGNEKLGLYYVK